MDLQKLLEAARKEEAALVWEGTFPQYLDMVVQNPSLARLSHARIYDMLLWSGCEQGLDEAPRYHLFDQKVFGMDRALARLVEYYDAASRRLEVRKRILLLMGPPASGKSTIVSLLKKGLEQYTRSEKGAMYAIQGCPMQEEPLHLIPETWREKLFHEYNVYIEGDLCPRCRYTLRYECQGDLTKMRVRRIAVSEREGVGIGTFVATDPLSQDPGRLVGTVDADLLTGDRLEAAGKAFRLDGELNVANRGIMEFTEIFKCDERFLAVLLSLAQEQIIKLGGFGTVYADEALLAHTNEGDLTAMIGNPRTEALLDRIIMVRIPYNLRVSEEVNIYRKLLKEAGGEKLHQSPLTLRLAATLSVLTRIIPPNVARISLTDKIRLYDGEHLPSFNVADVQLLQEEDSREGMFGLSPRYVMNRLSSTVAQNRSGCVLPIDLLRSLANGITERAGLDSGIQTRFPQLVVEAIKEHERVAMYEFQRAFSDRYEETAQQLFEDYIRNVVAYCNGEGYMDPVTGIERPHDERKMRPVEELLNIREGTKAIFRREMQSTYQKLVSEETAINFTTIPELRYAIQNLLLPDQKEIEWTINPDPRDSGRIQIGAEVRRRLVLQHGYCEICVQDLTTFLSLALRKKLPAQLKRGRLVWV